MTELPEQGGATPAPDVQLDDDGQEQGRDERGRFAPVKQIEQQQPEADPSQQPQQPQQQPEQGKPPPGYVPQEALHQARQQVDEWQRRSLAHEREMADIRRQLEASKPKPQEPQFWEKPEDYIRQQLESQTQPIQQSQEAMREQFSRMMAVDKFGDDVVTAAQKELEQRVYADPASNRHVYDRIVKSPHPYAELVKWHKEQATLKRVGDDPEAFINAEVERRMAERMSAGQQTQERQPQPTQQLPQSFATTRNNGPRSTTQAFSGPRPLSDIMGR